MKRGLLFLAAVCGLFATSQVASAQPSIDGTYLDQGGYTEITIRPCGSGHCGTITRIVMRKPGGFDTDVHNDNPALRDRPILGLRILSGLRWDDGAWRGEVYNPEDGGTYRAVVRQRRGGALAVQGCVAIFCRAVTWTVKR